MANYVVCMPSIAKVIRISRAKFHCSGLATVQDIQDYVSLIFLGHSVAKDVVYDRDVKFVTIILNSNFGSKNLN